MSQVHQENSLSGDEFGAYHRFMRRQQAVAGALFTVYKPFIKMIQIPSGFDIADNAFSGQLQPGDLVITADVPLAAEVIEKRGHALNPRGKLYTKDNIRERLAMRKLLDELRGSGMVTGGPSSLSQSDRQVFAKQLDRFLTKY